MAALQLLGARGRRCKEFIAHHVHEQTDWRGDRALCNKANGMTENLMLHFSRLWNFGCGSVPEGSIVHEKEPSQSFTSHDQSADLPFAGRLGDPPPTLPSWSFTLRSHFRVEVSRISFQYIFMVVLTLVKLATFFLWTFRHFRHCQAA